MSLKLFNLAVALPNTRTFIYTANVFQILYFRHLKNPYNDDEPIYSGPDGQIVKQNVAEELCRIFEAKIDSENWSASRNSTEPSTSRGIRSSSHLNPNHNHSRKNTEFY